MSEEHESPVRNWEGPLEFIEIVGILIHVAVGQWSKPPDFQSGNRKVIRGFESHRQYWS